MSNIVFRGYLETSLEKDDLQREMDTIACKWRTERPAHDVHSYEEFLQLARLHRDGPRACATAIANCRLAIRFPNVLTRWLAWHAVSISLTAVDKYGGYGRGFGTSKSLQSVGWGSGTWGGGGGWGHTGGWGGASGTTTKTPQKKKRRKARQRAAQAANEAAKRQEEWYDIHGLHISQDRWDSSLGSYVPDLDSWEWKSSCSRS